MVNDGSRDNTGIELKKLFYEKRQETPITIVQFSRNFGKEAAILAGMKHANAVETNENKNMEVISTEMLESGEGVYVLLSGNSIVSVRLTL